MKGLILVAIAVQAFCIVMAVRAGWHGDWAQGCFWWLMEISATIASLSRFVK